MTTVASSSIRNTVKLWEPSDISGLALWYDATQRIDFSSGGSIIDILNVDMTNGSANNISNVAGQGWRPRNVSDYNKIVDASGIGVRTMPAFTRQSISGTAGQFAFGVHNGGNQDASGNQKLYFVATQYTGTQTTSSATNNTRANWINQYLPTTMTTTTVADRKNSSFFIYWCPGRDNNVFGGLFQTSSGGSSLNTVNYIQSQVEVPPIPVFGQPTTSMPFIQGGTPSGTTVSHSSGGLSISANILNNVRTFAGTNTGQGFWLMNTVRLPITVSSTTPWTVRQVNSGNVVSQTLTTSTAGIPAVIDRLGTFGFGLYSGTTVSRPTAVAEVMWFEKFLTNDEILRLEGYCAWKYGARTLLPSTHPYRDTPPRL